MVGLEGFEPPTLGLEIRFGPLIRKEINKLARQKAEKSGEIRNPAATRIRPTFPRAKTTGREVVHEAHHHRTRPRSLPGPLHDGEVRRLRQVTEPDFALHHRGQA